MRILLITKESWDDSMYGNNVLTNWFGDKFSDRAEFAHLYCKDGIPKNNCCSKYFQITDSMVIKSYYTKKRAGKFFIREGFQDATSSGEEFNNERYKKLKKITTDFVRVVRDFVWAHAKYNEEGIKKFVEEFNPDIVFCPRLASRGVLKAERIVAKYTKAPFVVFTGDNEYSYKMVRFSIAWYINRMQIRKEIRNLTKKTYAHYYTLSELQAEEYKKLFGIDTSTLYKGGLFFEDRVHEHINKPIKIVYIGKFYCGRWKTLAKLAKCIKSINEKEQKVILQIYTKDNVSKKQNKLLNDGKNSFIMGSVDPDKIQSVYDGADIALHVEGLDVRNKLLTKYSFSTKITDCMASGCAVMVISWDKHSGYQYLKNNDIAFAMCNEKDIIKVLESIVSDNQQIADYAKKVFEYGKKYHQIENVRENLYQDFQQIIEAANKREEKCFQNKHKTRKRF